jgi:hypothetical protein
MKRCKLVVLCVGLISSFSCTHTVYKSAAVQPGDCVSSKSELSLRIVNEGAIGISRTSIQDAGKTYMLGGLKPGDSTCRVRAFATTKTPQIKITVIESGFFKTETTLDIKGFSLDSLLKTAPGNNQWTFRVQLAKTSGKINLQKFRFTAN